ncbi:MAG: hypothetical protein AAF217_14245 [Pseudomonadota bacterium]
MIRPGSEIEYPPSKALCNKARMIARMDALNASSKNVVSVLSSRFGSNESEYLAEITALSGEQQKLVDNMKRIVRA